MWNYELLRQGKYARHMWFEHHLVWVKSDWLDFERLDNREIIFAYSEEEARELGYPSDVLIGWPSMMSQGILEGINNDADIGLEDFGLTPPLTVKDLVDKWEQINELWVNGLTKYQISTIMAHAEVTYGEVYHHHWRVRRWLFPGVLDRFNTLIKDREMNKVDLEAFNENFNKDLTVDHLPTWPIKEEDVQQDPRLIFEIAKGLLTEEEQHSIEPDYLVGVMHGIEQDS